MRKLLCLCIVCMVLCSCSGANCIRVKGSFQGIEGEVEYCWNNEKSAKLERPVVNSQGREYIGLTTDELGGLWALLGKDKKKEEVGIKTIPRIPAPSEEKKGPAKIKPLAGLLKLLEEKKEEK